MKDYLIGSVFVYLVDVVCLILIVYEGLVVDYNIVVWLYFLDVCDLLVLLVVSYLDGGCQCEVVVDYG